MSSNRHVNSSDNKLLAAFGILIILTIIIGIAGIARIQGLSQRIENLGKHNLKTEKAILEMKINNTLYAAGIRNYAFWKMARYLGAAPMAMNLDNTLAVAGRFREQLKIYQDSAYTLQQKAWAGQIEASFNGLTALGSQIVESADTMESGSGMQEAVNNLMMAFENQLYRIDDFLDNTLGKANLDDIERQMLITGAEKKQAILFLILALSCAVAISGLIAFAVYYKRSQERLWRQQLFNQLINMEEDERKNLSAQVHDQMSQDLSALKISLGLIEQSLSQPSQEITAKLEQSKKIVSALIEKSHNIAFLLRPPALDEIGLIESIEELLLDYKRLTGASYAYRKPEGAFNLVPEFNLLFYRIAQELLTNMAKHARAKNVEICLSQGRDSAELFYRDDGVGFNYDEIIKRPLRRRVDRLKLGLLGLRERVEMLGGVLRIETAPGCGTRVTVNLPL